MIHTINSNSPALVRQFHPNASIIRRTGASEYTVFDRTEDALGHPSGIVIERGTITQDGRITERN